MNKIITVVLLLLAAGCSSKPQEAYAPPMDPGRRVSELDCSRQIDTGGANLMCREVAEAERLARIAEKERQARARREAEESAARERLERDRAEQEARAAAERECRRLEQERLDGRALLENFVANYGKVEEFKGIAGQITAFLDKARKVKPCPPA